MTVGNCGVGRNAKAATFVLALCMVASVLAQGDVRQPINKELEARLMIRPHVAHQLRQMGGAGAASTPVRLAVGITP